MAVHAGTVEVDLGHRTRRDVSHRFRRRPVGPGVWLLLAIGLAALVGAALRPAIGPRREPSRAARPAAVPATRPVVATSSSLGGSPAIEAESTGTPADPAAIAPDSSGIATDPPGSPAEPEPSAADPPAPGVVFRVQVGSFLELRNALRLLERLRGEQLPADIQTAQAQQTRYRVLAIPGAGETSEALLARLSALGLSAAAVNAQIAVTGFVPTEDADAIASRLEDEAIAVRVEREQRAVTYHAVRVGTYRAAQEAERARVQLAARGLEGVVVRESDDSRGAESPAADPRSAHF
jgi:cell division protein FtsN